MDLTIYNPANKRKEQLIEEFVVRTKLFNNVFDDIKTANNKLPQQHYLLIGQRGSGKTTLIHRIKYAIEDDKDLKNIIPITLGEEQYGISELVNLWEKIAEILDDYHGFVKLYDNIQDNIDKEEVCLEIITKELSKKNKNIVLFIDNFGDMLKKFSDLEIKRLREILTTNTNFRLVAASPVMIDQILDYQKPLFEFFKTVPLKGLDNNEITSLLRKLSDLDGSQNKIDNIIENHPERIEILRLLTGGVTRTIVSLYRIFIDNVGGTSIRDLQLTLDAVTPLYKHKMDDLPPMQQKIVDAVAKSWDATSVKEIVKATRLESKNISAQLKNLVRSQLIEKISTGKKNHLYQIKERFFNIWYLMRYGRKYDKKRVLWLVRFLESWCTKEELEDRVFSHIHSLQKGEFDHYSLVILGEAYLACKVIGIDIKKELIDQYKMSLPKDLTKGMTISDSDIFDSAFEKQKQGKFDLALNEILEIKDKSRLYNFIGYLYYHLKDYENSIKYYDLAAQKGDLLPIDFAIKGSVLRRLDRNKEAIEHLSQAFDEGINSSLIELGVTLTEEGDLELAKEKLMIGLDIEEIKKDSAHYLAHVYEHENLKKEAIKYFNLALELGDIRSNICLAKLFNQNDEFENAIKYYNKSLEFYPEEAALELAEVYIETNKLSEVKKLLTGIKDSKDADTQLSLGMIYFDKLNNNKKAKLHLNKAIKLNNYIAYKTLGKIYQSEGDFKKAEESFLNCYEEIDDYPSLFYLIDLYRYTNNSKKEALKHIENAKEGFEFSAQENILYALVLLWNDELEKSVELMSEEIEEFNEFLSHEDLEAEYDEVEIPFDHESRLSGIIEFFVELISYEYYNVAFDMLEKFELIDAFKPIYFALMSYMKNEFPEEHLKMGDEIKEVVEGMIANIEKRKSSRLN
jgi:tetratricopeptide (TPR) repeat protein